MESPMNRTSYIKRYIVILGPYRSGSSCLAGVLSALGVEFGACMRVTVQNPKGFFEYQDAQRRLKAAFDESRTLAKVSDEIVRQILSDWQSDLSVLPAPVVGMKHPLLCILGSMLDSVFS